MVEGTDVVLFPTKKDEPGCRMYELEAAHLSYLLAAFSAAFANRFWATLPSWDLRWACLDCGIAKVDSALFSLFLKNSLELIIVCLICFLEFY